jgi:heterodisulfide reductase subunit C
MSGKIIEEWKIEENVNKISDENQCGNDLIFFSKVSKMKKKFMRKITKQNILEANNLLEEVAEIFEPCISCGLCNGVCPTFKVLLDERVSPRGYALKLREKIVDESIYEYIPCKACDDVCPLKIQITEGILKAREVLFLRGKSLKKNEALEKS